VTRPVRSRSAFACACLSLAVMSCSHEAPEEVESETPVSVRVQAASRGSIRGLIRATGVVTPAPGADLVVVAPEAARIAAIPRAVGERVRRGDVLVRFEIPSSAADVERQEAEVRRADAAIANATAAQARARELFARGVAARRDVEEADRALADASAALAQAQASLKAARIVAARATVHATFDGIVAERRHNAGDLVEATASDSVMRVIDPGRLEVVASIPLADAPRIHVGAPARVVGAPSQGSEGTLKVVSRPVAVEQGTATVPVRLAFSAVPSVSAGTPVQVAIAAEEHADAVLVPPAAIVREGEETYVFVAGDGKAHRRAVTIGLRDEERVEIVSGVNANDQVIVDGNAGLPDEAAITIVNDAADTKDAAAGRPAGAKEAK
jgi:RND family efflux transporter MFP subunit